MKFVLIQQLLVDFDFILEKKDSNAKSEFWNKSPCFWVLGKYQKYIFSTFSAGDMASEKKLFAANL